MFFTSNLLYLINKKQISQSELARQLGIDRQQITRYLKGNEPNYDRLIKISDVLNVSIDDLLKKDLSK